MCQTRNNETEAATTSTQCSRCKSRGTGQCPAARMPHGAQILPVINASDTAGASSTAPTTATPLPTQMPTDHSALATAEPA